MALSPDDQTLEFGHFELDLRAAVLRRDGQPVHLPPQQFQALAHLASRAGELVTRDELRQRLWGDDEFVDFDGGLNFCIGQLRQALGDRAAAPEFIQTVPRRGYRFIAEVATRRAAAARPGRPWTWMVAASIAGLIAGAIAGVTSMRSHRGIDRVEPSAREQLIFEQARTGLESAPRSALAHRVRLFQQAIADNPSYAEAFGGLALAHSMAASTRVAPVDDAYTRARTAALRALAVDDRIADAHAALGVDALFNRLEWNTAETHLARALSLDPDHVTALVALSRRRSGTGDHAAAIALAERAARATRTPDSAARAALGWAHLFAGDAQQAIPVCEALLEDSPEQSYACLFNAYLDVHREADAAAVLLRTSRAGAAPGPVLERLAHWQSAGGAEALWRWQLGEVRRAAGFGGTSAARTAESLAILHGRLGEVEDSLAHLREAIAARSTLIPVLRVHPGFRRLHGDARFEALLRQLRLPAL